jgi:conjugative relaxase-like TrwC/TraI family protein
VLVFHPIGRGQAGYYLDGPGAGRWLGVGSRALALEGTVGGAALLAVLDGRRPGGEPLLARVPGNRRAGYDLIFAAPKSFSLVSDLAPADVGARLVEAHLAAVHDVVAYLERVATAARRGGRTVSGDGLVGAAFDHRSSRSGDPHVHTHVVVANLVSADGRWSCLDRLALRRGRAGAGAVYQASLRHHVAVAGVALGWMVRSDGLADVAGVPRAAIEACSTRRAELAGGQPEGQPAAARTRSEAGATARRDWRQRAAAGGLDRDAVTRLLAAPARGRVAGRASVEDVVTATRSTFSRSELVAALAATSERGAPAVLLEAQADLLLRGAITVGERWTTARQRQLGDEIVRLTSPRQGAAGVVPPELVAGALDRRPHLSPVQRAAVARLTTGGATVDVLEPGPLLSWADVMGAASTAWRAAGHRVAVVTTSTRGGDRWSALTAIGGPPAPPARPSVTIVDGADRLPTSALHPLVHDAARRGAKVVLVPGARLASQHAASPALALLLTRPGLVVTGPGPLAGPSGHVRGTTAGLDGAVVVCPTAAEAVARLVDDWLGARDDAVPAVMVAAGPEEAEHLNRLARERLSANRELTGPALHPGGRQLREGDEVRVVKRMPALRLTAGMTGVVALVDAGRAEALIQWPGRTTVASVATLAGPWWAHAYATTPPFLRHEPASRALSLGRPPEWLPSRHPPTVYVVEPEPARRRLAVDPVGRLVAELEPPARAGACPVGPSLREVADAQARTAAGHLSGCPDDVRAELRIAAEERAWAASAGPPGDQAWTRRVERRHEDLVAAHLARRSWIERHRDGLERWAELDDAAVWRALALTKAAGLAPTRAVTDLLGRRPSEEPDLQAWSRAAGAIEAYRDRWGVPDRPLPSSAADLGPDPGCHAEYLQVLHACGELGAGRALSGPRGPGGREPGPLPGAGREAAEARAWSWP